MRRRRFVMAGAACCAGLAPPFARGDESLDYLPPERFSRPELASDEGGLWAIMDREEHKLRSSPFLVNDEKVTDYLKGIVCRLAGDHCPDVRVYLVRTPYFNANMAPNGMMQVWSGLLLRAENEAQLAAVLGHEVGHFMQRHTLNRLHDMRMRAGWANFLAVFGRLGQLGQLGVTASAFAYGRDQEREADRVGAVLMHRANYDVREASVMWDNLLAEVKARDGKDPTSSLFFGTHPSIPERRETLASYSQVLTGGEVGAERYTAMTRPFLAEWVSDEVKRGQHEESLVLLSRQIAHGRSPALMYFSRGEVYRHRNGPGDSDSALADYQQATQLPDPPAAAFRGIGMIQRDRGAKGPAAAALARYLELAPDAPDAAFVKTYLAELRS